MADRASLRTGWTLLSGLVSERGLEVERGIAYGPHPRHTLDVYHGRAVRNGAPIVLFFYGGGWTSGDRALYAFVGSALATNGVTTVIADYRLYPEVRFPAFCHDAAMAYGWVRDWAAQKERRPVVVMGHSAGAHIAALMTFDPVYRASGGLPLPDALIGLSGPFAFDPTSWPSTQAIFANALTADAARPVVQAFNGGPPTLLIHGGADQVVHPVAVDMMADALTSVGTPVSRHVYPGVGHSGLIMTFAQPLRWRAPLLGDVLAFLRGF